MKGFIQGAGAARPLNKTLLVSTFYIMQNPADEIKSRLDIVDVIREYIQLKPAGINFRALCPFHREKTPSFIVSPEKQIWHCFGCSRGGDIFSFIMGMEGLSFVEALRLLASKAGVQLKKQDPKLTSQRNRLLDIIELASKYYHKILLDNEQAKEIRDYLAKRGLASEIIKEWQVGYSLDSWDDLLNFLKSKGYSENEIFLAGMIVKKEKAAGFYDRFRGRVMFPIRDINGNAVGFSARISPAKEASDKMGKYINNPQTMIYDKSKILFGLDQAKLAIKKEDLAVIVEGQMDVITAHQHGFTNLVASSGTALTADQVALLKRYSPNLALAFDMDKSGELAAERGIAQAMQAEMNIKVIELPIGKDPDECIKREPDKWRQAVANAKPVMQYYFDKTIISLDLEKVENKRRAVKVLLPVIAKLGNKIEQDFWLKQLSQTTEVAENLLREALSVEINQATPGRQARPTLAETVQSKLGREEMLSELLLALMLKFSLHLEYVISQISPDQIVGLTNQSVYRSLIIYYNKVIDKCVLGEQDQSAEINYQDLKDWLKQNKTDNNNEDNQLQLLGRLALLADKDFYDYSLEQAGAEIIKIITILKRYYLSSRLKEIAKLITLSEKEIQHQDREGKLRDLLEEFKMLSEEMREMEG